mmetsp:Transcript_5826/g.13890  ORF Transcript_5826/g.13890 Transcript_5826/m.13890 type:complete len:659 (-) Transcript_5826:122-2098(-)
MQDRPRSVPMIRGLPGRITPPMPSSGGCSTDASTVGTARDTARPPEPAATGRQAFSQAMASVAMGTPLQYCPVAMSPVPSVSTTPRYGSATPASPCASVAIPATPREHPPPPLPSSYSQTSLSINRWNSAPPGARPPLQAEAAAKGRFNAPLRGTGTPTGPLSPRDPNTSPLSPGSHGLSPREAAARPPRVDSLTSCTLDDDDYGVKGMKPAASSVRTTQPVPQVPTSPNMPPPRSGQQSMDQLIERKVQEALELHLTAAGGRGKLESRSRPEAQLPYMREVIQQLRQDVTSLVEHVQEVDHNVQGMNTQLQDHIVECRQYLAEREEYAELPGAIQRLEQRCADLSKRMIREAQSKLSSNGRPGQAQGGDVIDALRARVLDLEQVVRSQKAEFMAEWEERRKKMQSHFMQTAKGVAHGTIADEVEPLLRKERERIQGLLGDVEEIAKTSRAKLTNWLMEQLEVERQAREELRVSIVSQLREEARFHGAYLQEEQSGGADDTRELWRRQVATQLDELRDIIKVGLREERQTLESRCRKLSESVRLQVEEVVEQMLASSVKDWVAAAIQAELDAVRSMEPEEPEVQSARYSERVVVVSEPCEIQAAMIAEEVLVPEVLDCSQPEVKPLKAFSEFVDQERSFSLHGADHLSDKIAHVNLGD